MKCLETGLTQSKGSKGLTILTPARKRLSGLEARPWLLPFCGTGTSWRSDTRLWRLPQEQHMPVNGPNFVHQGTHT